MSERSAAEKGLKSRERGLALKAFLFSIVLTAATPAKAEAQEHLINNSETGAVCQEHEQNPLQEELENIVMGGFGRINLEERGLSIYTLNTLDDNQIDRLLAHFNNCALRSAELQIRYRDFINRLLLEITARQEYRTAYRASGGNLENARERYRQVYANAGVDINAIERAQNETLETLSGSNRRTDPATIVRDANNIFSSRLESLRLASHS